jgi:hypothetical protein
MRRWRKRRRERKEYKKGGRGEKEADIYLASTMCSAVCQVLPTNNLHI